METFITEGIVLRASDYKDYDKLLRLLTPGRGVVTAAIKGVKRPKAKLKYAAQPFSVNEYTLVERNGYHTVTECSPIDAMYAVTYDPDAYAAGSVMLETTEYAVNEIASPYMFAYLLQALGQMAYASAPPYAVCARYLIELLDRMGYGRTYGGSIGEIAMADIRDLRAFSSAGRGEVKKLAAICGECFLHEIKSVSVL